MPNQALQSGRSRKYSSIVSVGDLRLDLTSARSQLGDSDVSRLVGADVINPGRLAKWCGRRPLDITEKIPSEDLPLTTAIRSDFHGNYVNTYTARSGSAETDFDASGLGYGAFFRWEYLWFRYSYQLAQEFTVQLSPAGEELFGPFTEDMVGGSLSFDSTPWSKPKRIIEYGVQNFASLFGFENKFLKLDPVPFLGIPASGMQSRFLGTANEGWSITIAWTKFYDKRGIWVSNGQKFWLLQGSKYTLYMDLGDQSETRGLEWRGSQISPNVFMFVHPRHPARIISLNAEPLTDEPNEVSVTRTIGGMLPPSCGPSAERQPNVFAIGGQTCDSRYESGDGVDSDGDGPCKMKVRVVDDTTGSVSAFIDCYTSSDPLTLAGLEDELDVSSIGSGAISISRQPTIALGDLLVNPGGRQLKTARATHVEFWRTPVSGDGTIYFLEARKPITWPAEDFYRELFADHTYSTFLSDDPTINNGWCLKKSDEELRVGTVMTPSALRAGGLPPLCRDIVAFDGMNVVGGASPVGVDVQLQGRTIRWPRLDQEESIRYSEILEGSVLVESFHVNDRRQLSRLGDLFQGFALVGKTGLVVMSGGVHRMERDGSLFSARPIGERGIGTAWSKSILSLRDVAMWLGSDGLMTYNATKDTGQGEFNSIAYAGMKAYFDEANERGWVVETGYDERFNTIHVRRVMRIAAVPPDNGGPAVIITPIDDIIVVPPDVDVDEIPPVIDYPGDAGAIPIDPVDPPDGGFNPLGPGDIRDSNPEGPIFYPYPKAPWIIPPDSGLVPIQRVYPREVSPVPGDVVIIDPPVDPIDHIPHSPHELGESVPPPSDFESTILVDSAIFSLQTGRWTVIEDDTGFRYVSSSYADLVPLIKPALYSVDELGAVFEENYAGIEHPYDSLTVQDAIDGDYEVTEHSIRHLSLASFGSVMVGDVIRFRSQTPGVNGAARKILTADEYKITFNALPTTLIEGDEFIIGAVRFRVRFSPETGSKESTIKVLEGLHVMARPTERHVLNGAWTNPPEGRIAVRAYRNYSNTANVRDSERGELVVAGESDSEMVTNDSESAIEIEGGAIELELESLDARTEFEISSVIARFREDGVEQEDVSTES